MSAPRITDYGPSARVVTIGPRRYYFSYETCVAFDDGAGRQVQTDRVYSRTTSGHLTKMGAKHFAKLPDAEFVALISA